MERGNPFPCRHTHTNTFKLQMLYSSGFPTSTMASSGFLSSLQVSIEIAPAYFCLVKERTTPNSAHVVSHMLCGGGDIRIPGWLHVKQVP